MLLTTRTINDLSFTLKLERVEEIEFYVKEILKIIKECDIYLFGSFSKGCIKESSDIDLLVIVPELELDSRDRMKLRIQLREHLDDLDIKREADAKVYGELDYKEISSQPSFEKSILKDLILLYERW